MIFSVDNRAQFKSKIKTRLEEIDKFKENIDKSSAKNPIQYWTDIYNFLNEEVDFQFIQDELEKLVEGEDLSQKEEKQKHLKFINELDLFKDSLIDLIHDFTEKFDGVKLDEFDKLIHDSPLEVEAVHKGIDEVNSLKKPLNKFHSFYKEYYNKVLEYLDKEEAHAENVFSDLAITHNELTQSKNELHSFAVTFSDVLQDCKHAIQMLNDRQMAIEISKEELTIRAEEKEKERIRIQENEQKAKELQKKLDEKNRRDQNELAKAVQNGPRLLDSKEKIAIYQAINGQFFEIAQYLDKDGNWDVQAQIEAENNFSWDNINQMLNDIPNRITKYQNSLKEKGKEKEFLFENASEKTRLITPTERTIINTEIERHFKLIAKKIKKTIAEHHKKNNAPPEPDIIPEKLPEEKKPQPYFSSEQFKDEIKHAAHRQEKPKPKAPVEPPKLPQEPLAEKPKKVENKFKLNPENVDLLKSLRDECKKYRKHLSNYQNELTTPLQKEKDYLTKINESKPKGKRSSVQYKLATKRVELWDKQTAQVESKLKALSEIEKQLDLLEKENPDLNLIKNKISPSIEKLTARRDTGGLVGISRRFWTLIDKLCLFLKIPKSTMGITGNSLSKKLSFFIDETLKNNDSDSSKGPDIPSPRK